MISMTNNQNQEITDHDVKVAIMEFCEAIWRLEDYLKRQNKTIEDLNLMHVLEYAIKTIKETE